MDWLYYLIEGNIYLGILYAFYHFVLKREPFYVVNRWYLLAITLISFLLPFFTVRYSSTAEQYTGIPVNGIIYDHRPSVSVALPKKQHTQQIKTKGTFWQSEQLITRCYLIVMSLLLLITFKDLYRLLILYHKSPKQKNDGVVYIQLDCKKEEIFSFFNWLFLHPRMRKKQVILAHELVHIQQGHSYDVVLFELMRCINWFNPCIYLLCKDAKLNHEYLADQYISSTMQNKYDYANLLIEHAYFPEESLSHSAFSQSQLEQRIIHLGKQSGSRKALIKYLALLPLIAFLIFLSAFKVEKSYGWIDFTVNTIQSQKSHTILTYSSTPKAVASETKQAESNSNSLLKGIPAKLNSAKTISVHQLSELVSGPTTMQKLAVKMAREGKKLYAIDYELFWAKNATNAKIRNVIHSICVGTEAQLFRGKVADTLYIDRGFYTIDHGIVKIKTDNLWISNMDFSPEANRALILIDASKREITARLDRVDIRTTGLIHSIVLNPYFGYGKDGIIDSVPKNHVDVKKRDANRRYVSNMSNVYVREAKITTNEIITNENKLTKEDQRQAGIIWQKP